MKDIEILVQEAIKYIECENTRDANISLVNLYRTVQSNPSCLQSVNDYAIIGKGFTLMLCNQLSDDIDTLQTISSIAYLCLSRAIDMNIGYDAFKYTVMSVLEQGMDGFSNLMFQSRADILSRNALWEMEFTDIERHPSICISFPFFEDRKNSF